MKGAAWAETKLAKAIRRRARFARRVARAWATRAHDALAAHPRARRGGVIGLVVALHLVFFTAILNSFHVDPPPPFDAIIIEFFEPPPEAASEREDEAEQETVETEAEAERRIAPEEDEEETVDETEDEELRPQDEEPPLRRAFSIENLPVPSRSRVVEAIPGVVCVRVGGEDSVSAIYCPHYDRGTWVREAGELRRVRRNPTLDEIRGPPVPQEVRDLERFRREGRTLRRTQGLSGNDTRSVAGLGDSPVPELNPLPTPSWARDRAELGDRERIEREYEEAAEEDEDG